MKTTRAIFGILTNRTSQTCEITQPVSGRQPVLALLMRLLWAAALVLPALSAQAGVALTTLWSFGVFTNGAGPVAGLVQGSDGYFYGTTQSGGTNGGFGTVFKTSPNGALTNLYSFTGGSDGGLPQAGLVQGSDGNLYGTTYGGGTNNRGTVFKISPNGALTSLYSFTGGNDGGDPQAGLVRGSDGNFYGTTCGGGANNAGTVFKISPTGALTSLYSFTGGSYGALRPQAGLVQGSDGNFYGTTANGGANYGGNVFKISANGVTTLYSFTGGNDGAFPNWLVQGSDGNFYGTTSWGGGTVFKISTDGALTSLHLFTGGNDGADPRAGLVQGSDGDFYGTTYGGGTNNRGTVFKISTNGALTSLYSFTGGNDGADPQAGLVQSSDGNFYGTTQSGGRSSAGTVSSGTVFKISTNGALTSLYSFTGDAGAGPVSGLVRGSDGWFYGTTAGGAGTVFKTSTSGALAILYSFTGGTDGAQPQAGVVQGSDGNFYGTTQSGGTNGGGGTVFKISANGALTSLYSFTGGNDGADPHAGLVQGSDGDFYGTTYGGGTNNRGTVFKISPNGALTSLYSFTGGNDGGDPQAGLVQGSDGNFYGTTYNGGPNYAGNVFKISANGALTSLYVFTGETDGARSWAGLVQGSDGNFYGTTEGGGIDDYGTVFRINTNGAVNGFYLTILHLIFFANHGTTPQGALVQGSDGNFYGTTFGGGANNAGTVFKISTNGTLTSLYSFTGGNDGAQPQAGLVQGSDGWFYGTTSWGGEGSGGTVFRLNVGLAAPVFQHVELTNGTLSMTWSTEAGGTYQLRCNSDLSSSNWTNLGSAVTATGPTLSATDSVTNDPRRFYRVVLLPQGD